MIEWEKKGQPEDVLHREETSKIVVHTCTQSMGHNTAFRSKELDVHVETQEDLKNSTRGGGKA